MQIAFAHDGIEYTIADHSMQMVTFDIFSKDPTIRGKPTALIDGGIVVADERRSQTGLNYGKRDDKLA
jgi:hypothetical protein